MGKNNSSNRRRLFDSLWVIRLVSVVCPPAGLWLLWRSPDIPRRAKVLGTWVFPLYLVVYLTGVWALLAYGCGIDTIGWREGYRPYLTFSKRLANRDAIAAIPRGSMSPATGSVKYTNAYWSGFRGSDRRGVYDERPILTNWPMAGLRNVWRQPCGGGFSSFAVAEGRLYTIEQRREMEVATAYDMETGQELWRNSWETHFEGPELDNGPRSTPTYDCGRVYVLGAAGEFRCLQAATGATIWRRNIIDETHAPLTLYGAAASPLIAREKVIVLPGARDGQSVAAYNKETGALIWKQGSDHQAYTSPMLVSLAGRSQLLLVSARNISGADPETGQELWHVPWVVPVDNAIAQPVLWDSNRFMVSAGYGLGSRAYEISASNSVFNVRELWRSINLKNKFSTSVFYKGFIYGLDEDRLACIDAATGVRQWKGSRYGYGQLLLATGHLVILAEDGTLALVEATPETFNERARFSALRGQAWNHPAMADGKIFIRNAREMACYEIGG